MGACLIDAGGLWMDIKKNFCIFFTICWYAPEEQPPSNLAEANKILANDESVKWSSKPTDPIKQGSKNSFQIVFGAKHQIGIIQGSKGFL
jgi:hypothetical protein